MTFLPEKTDEFLEIFNHSKDKIRAFKDCKQIKLLNDIHQPNVFFTHSVWDNEAYLEQYRQSELFRDTWAKTKALFQSAPQAWSLQKKS